MNSKGEHDSNLLQLLQTQAEDVPEHGTWIMNSPDKFTSTDIQNKHLSIMALSILRGIANSISGKWFTIMVDESTDLSNTDQMVFAYAMWMTM